MIKKGLVLIGALLAFASSVQAEGEAAGVWQTVKSPRIELFYEQGLSLDEINQKIKLKNPSWTTLANKMDADANTVTQKLETIIQRVTQILDMSPKNLRVVLYVYKNKSEVEKVFQQNFNQLPHQALWYDEVLAFYNPRDKTIYVFMSDLRTSVLAHEMAHAVIAQYFIIAPPVKVQEILAMHVDREFSI